MFNPLIVYYLKFNSSINEKTTLHFKPKSPQVNNISQSELRTWRTLGPYITTTG